VAAEGVVVRPMQPDEEYSRALELRRLFCQPNAYNVAPNRTLQRVGFTYLSTEEMQPSFINFVQPVTRWVLERPR
jgi:RimJ/RimL family protein N-acetyltransferase